MVIDLSLSRGNLVYEGCEISIINGSKQLRFHLATPADEAVQIIKKNLTRLLSYRSDEERKRDLEIGEVILTGKTMIQVYLVVALTVAPGFKNVFFQKGFKDKKIQIK